MTVRNLIIRSIIVINFVIASLCVIFTQTLFYLLILPLIPLTVALYHVTQKKHDILRNYPLVGKLRYFFEGIRPEMRQYFWESDTDGRPFNRRQRSIVYQRAKNERETVAFGMQNDPNEIGNEWAAHSVYPTTIENKDRK